MTKQNLKYFLFLFSLPLLYYGFSNFAYQNVSSNLEALLISITCTLGLLFFFGSFYTNHFFIDNVTPTPIPTVTLKTKDIIMDVSNPPIITSVDLMKQEQQLNQRKEQLKEALEQVEQEKLQIQQSLQDRGWIRKINGEWTVG